MKINICSFVLLAICVCMPLGSYAENSNSKYMVGFSFSGPVAGITFTSRLTDEYQARVIYSSGEMYALQLHRYPSLSDSKHYIFGAGVLNDTPYLRGAVGKAKDSGSWRFSAELGLNVPLEKVETEGEGLIGVINAGMFLIFLGAGLHYTF